MTYLDCLISVVRVFLLNYREVSVRRFFVHTSGLDTGKTTFSKIRVAHTNVYQKVLCVGVWMNKRARNA